jgi:hypothetical protein
LRCEECKYGTKSTHDGLRCADKETDATKCLAPDSRYWSGESSANSSICRLCEYGYTPNHLGVCVDDEKADVWNEPDDVSEDRNFNGGLMGCKFVQYYLYSGAGSTAYKTSRIDYTWKKKCLEDEPFNKNSFPGGFVEDEGFESVHY